MTSFYNAIGENPNSTGDIAIGHSVDGNSIQAFMLTTDHGIIAYELTGIIYSLIKSDKLLGQYRLLIS